jgi:hypothetical protein
MEPFEFVHGVSHRFANEGADDHAELVGSRGRTQKRQHDFRLDVLLEIGYVGRDAQLGRFQAMVKIAEERSALVQLDQDSVQAILEIDLLDNGPNAIENLLLSAR